MSKLPELTTKSGKAVTLGAGSGTKWRIYKLEHPEEFKNDELSEGLVDSLVLSLKNGFNHVDTAEAYQTHPEVAEALKRAQVDREDVFLTDKYSVWQKFSDGPYDSINLALQKFGTDYVDLYLLHAPFIDKKLSGVTLEEAWLECVKAQQEGLVRHIGVSNFRVSDFEKLAKVTDVVPSVNQVEFHPYLQEQTAGLSKYSQENNILLEAYGPLTPLFRAPEGPLKPVLPELAKKYGKTEAQILLRWTLQEGALPITTSSKEERIREALDVYNFELSEEDQVFIRNEGKKAHHRFFMEQFDK